jgi:hypothetical protein
VKVPHVVRYVIGLVEGLNRNTVNFGGRGCDGVSSPSTLAACAPTHSSSFAPPSFRPVHVHPNSSLCIQPACGLHQNSFSAGRHKIPSGRCLLGSESLTWRRGPLMELRFGFSPTPPGRYLWFLRFFSLACTTFSIHYCK